MNVEVQHRKNLTLESVDKGDDAKYFLLSEINPNLVEIKLRKTLENIVDNDTPQNILKFRLICIPDEQETTPSFLSITVYVEDVNDNRPQFLNLPYHVTVEELTPIGLTVFRGIQAIDLDKPNTANSDINFSIVEGNDDGKFTLESSHRAALVVKKSLDYDSGDHEFRLKIMASDRGNPPLSTTTILTVKVLDSDDLPPIFTQQVYKTQIKEFYPFTNRSIHQEIIFPSPIMAYDQDLGINASIQYDIVSGNELEYFEINPHNGSLFLIREVDRAALASNLFNLQIRSKQLDDTSKFGLSKVEIEIIDLNNHLPQFEVDVYNISIMENLPNGFSVVQVLARDSLDQGENSEFVYKLEDRSRAFTIDPKTGWLTVRDQSQLDRERVSSIKLKVFADEKLPNVAFGGTRSQAVVEIMLLDANDNNPTFVPSNLYKFQVTIDSEIGSVVGQVIAQDADLAENGRVVYELQKSNTSNDEVPFEIDARNGYIFLLERPLPKLQYTLLVEAADQPINPSERRYSLAVVQIDVVKAGSNHSPEFIGSPYEFWVGTHVGIGTSVGQVKVKELDPKFTVYDLLHSYYEGVPFAIEERTGIIAVVDDLIKYPRSHYDFEAYVTDSRHTLTTNLTIHVVDPIDSVTESSREPIELHVKENVGGAIIANLRTLLGDGSRETKSPMEFLLANYDARDKFAIASDGTVYTLKGLDREEKARHLLTVISQNRGVIQGQGVYQIFVNVDDVNDNPPKFEKPLYEARVRENSNPGTPLTMEHPVKVIDPDEGSNAEFMIELKGEGAERFRVDPKNGKLYVGNIPLDREEKQVYQLKLIATDKHGNLSSSVGLTVRVDDINDNSPVIFDKIIVLDPPELDSSSGQRELLRSSASQPISVEISNTEPIKIPETTPVGNKIARVMASDRDVGDNSKIAYRIVSENSNPLGGKFSFLTDKQYLFSRNKDKHFMIDRVTGEISVAKPLKPDTEYALNISATDRGGLRSYTGIRVVVEDINNMIPKFEQPWYSFELLEGHYLRGEIGKVQAQDGDVGKNGEIVYKIQTKEGEDIPSDKFPFNIDGKTGLIYVNGDIDREKLSRYNFQIAATDLGTPSLESVVDIDIAIIDRNDEAPKFYGYSNAVKSPKDGKLTPIYRTSVKSDVPPMTPIITVMANDSDYAGNGNGLVLFHLKDHHKEFYVDSKNGTISTLTNLDYEFGSDYNLTVVASDLGKPSLSSSAWVLVRVIGSKVEGNGQVKERMFEQEVYSFQLPFAKATQSKFPAVVGKMSLSDKFRKYQNEYDIFGEESVTSKFRVEPRSGELVLLEKLDEDKTYEFLVRAFNTRVTRGFDTRQGSHISDRILENNEALVRVEVLPSPTSPLPSIVVPITTHNPFPTTRPSTTTKRTIPTTTVTKLPTSSEPTIVTKGPYSPISPSRVYPSSPEYPNILDTGKKSPQKNSNLYAGEIAVLTLSCVIFLGGLVAAISIACVRKRRRRLSRRRSHMPAIPVEVRLQKQMPSRTIGNAPNRTVIFPMALPTEPLHTESSDNTSDTYTDTQEVLGGREVMGGGGGGGNHHRESKRFGIQNALSICPDCRKIRKPNGAANHGGARRSHRNLDRGPMKSGVVRPREFSLPSSNDSGIDGSDGHCTCCQSHNNSSSESGREQYEDSLMPNLTQRPKSFKRKRTNQQSAFSANIHRASVPTLRQQLSTQINRRADRIVIL
ncbi:unnamed protein product [Allacma fusca]|uniref:Cadherin domain-containing protein n=1 Tax=Allacma fusca TaxID=39272 RepID=A0A8J2P459_9HEXA|nr:unnamed protein product [Allacma fusca]